MVLFGLGSAVSDIMNTDNIDFFILRNSELLVALIFGLFLAFGFVIDWGFSYLDARMPGKQHRSKALIALYAGLTAIGLLIVAAPGSAGAGLGELCDCEVPIRAILSYTIVAVATLIFWFGSMMKRPAAWMMSVAAALGYLGTVGVVIFGLIRAIRDAVDIIG